MDYCAPADLHAFGLSRSALSNPGRLIAAVDVSANTFALNVHGYALNDVLSFRAEGSGSLPAPIVAGASYYAIPVSESHFSVAAAPDGAAIDLTTAGARVVVITPLPIASAISWASRIVDDSLPAHVVPLAEPIHELVRMTAAELAAGKLLALLGHESVSLSGIVDNAQKRLARWAKGIPLSGENTPAPANKAASATAPYTDSAGWREHGGI